jgi:Prealbumin-like fold domain
MSAVRFRQRRVRRWWYLVTTLTVTAFVAALFVAGSSANLAGSTFESNDGNLVVNTTGNSDWANAPNRVRGDDLASGGSDNSFGGGTKEDDPNVNVVTGSIPPNKSDLTRFYVASEFKSNSNFLYLAWERSNVLGSANMDFELNQKAQPDLTTTGPKTLVRTAGDILITFDFGGSGAPVLGLLKWVTSGATSQCFATNSLPCWGNRVNLSAAGFADGAVNTVTVTDPIANVSLPAGTFGEAAVNLTAAGVFPAGTCEALGSAFLKSRASASFPAEVKDFVAPQPVNISNCGRVIIKKRTNPRGINQQFSFTSNLAGTTLSCTQPSPETPTSFSLNDSGNSGTGDSAANTQDCTNVPLGSYTVTEGTLPSGFVLESLTCQATGSSSGSQDATNPLQANITLANGGDVVTCIYVDKQQLGAIKITKTSSKAAATPLAGAKFSITSGGNPIAGSPFTTGADGTICVDGLVFGDYVVTETAAPPGYQIDDSSGHTVTVGTNSSCPNTNIPDTQKLSFTDTPLTDLSVHVASQVSGGTQSSIRCVGPSPATTDVGNSPEPDSGFADPVTVTANGLVPGTYTCTVVIDP